MKVNATAITLLTFFVASSGFAAESATVKSRLTLSNQSEQFINALLSGSGQCKGWWFLNSVTDARKLKIDDTTTQYTIIGRDEREDPRDQYMTIIEKVDRDPEFGFGPLSSYSCEVKYADSATLDKNAIKLTKDAIKIASLLMDYDYSGCVGAWELQGTVALTGISKETYTDDSVVYSMSGMILKDFDIANGHISLNFLENKGRSGQCKVELSMHKN